MSEDKVQALEKELVGLKSKLSDLESRNSDAAHPQEPLFRFITPLIISAAVSIVGLYATWVYNERQVQLAQIEALDKYRKYLESDVDTERKFAYEVFKALGYKELVLELIELRADNAGIGVARAIENSEESSSRMRAAAITDKIMAQAASPENVVPPPPVSTRHIKEKKSGWVYLGHFDSKSGGWKTRYLDFADHSHPEDLEGTTQTVRHETGALNVRDSPPGFTGDFGKVLNALSAGSEVNLGEIDEWYSSGYIWAEVTYGEE